MLTKEIKDQANWRGLSQKTNPGKPGKDDFCPEKRKGSKGRFSIDVSAYIHTYVHIIYRHRRKYLLLSIIELMTYLRPDARQ